MHGRHRGVPAGPKLAEPIKEVARQETRRRNDAAPGAYRREQRRDQAVNMKQGHHVQTNILGRESQGLLNVPGRSAEVLLGQGNDLRPGGGS